jgi:hypothetical protein
MPMAPQLTEDLLSAGADYEQRGFRPIVESIRTRIEQQPPNVEALMAEVHRLTTDF